MITMYVWTTQPGASGARSLFGLVFTVTLLAAAFVWGRRRQRVATTGRVRPAGRIRTRSVVIGVGGAIVIVALAQLVLQVLDAHSVAAWIVVYLVALTGTWILQTVWERFARGDPVDDVER